MSSLKTRRKSKQGRFLCKPQMSGHSGDVIPATGRDREQGTNAEAVDLLEKLLTLKITWAGTSEVLIPRFPSVLGNCCLPRVAHGERWVGRSFWGTGISTSDITSRRRITFGFEVPRAAIIELLY